MHSKRDFRAKIFKIGKENGGAHDWRLRKPMFNLPKIPFYMAQNSPKVHYIAYHACRVPYEYIINVSLSIWSIFEKVIFSRIWTENGRNFEKSSNISKTFRFRPMNYKRPVKKVDQKNPNPWLLLMWEYWIMVFWAQWSKVLPESSRLSSSQNSSLRNNLKLDIGQNALP